MLVDRDSILGNLDEHERQVILDLERLVGKKITIRNSMPPTWLTSFSMVVDAKGKHVIGLAIINQGLSSLPESFGQLTNLEHLNLWGNQLTSLPESFGRLTSLKELDLALNRLNSLPESFGQLHRLQKLDLRWNRLNSLPESFGQLHRLEYLDLEGNRLNSLPESFGRLSNLQELSLWRNRLNSLPESFGRLTSLKRLNLGGNRLNSLPKSFRQLHRLEYLDLESNQLTSLPESFGRLTNLQTLSLAGNQLTSLPESFGRLRNLQELSLRGNRLNSLPESFGQLHRLQKLDLRWNRLNSLPESFGHLTSLKELSLWNNQLNSLPESFGRLTNLELLDLRGNDFKYVDVTSFLEFKHLKTFRVDALLVALADRRPSSASEIPEGLRHKEIRWLSASELRRFKRDWIWIWQVKVVLVGAMEMGKTSLARALTRHAVFEWNAEVIINGKTFTKADFKENDTDPLFLKVLTLPREQDRTVGLDSWFLRIPLDDGGNVSLDSGRSEEREFWELAFWDFAGHQTYRVVHQPFLTDDAIYLLVFHPKYLDLKRLEIPYWYHRVKSVARTSHLLYIKTRSNEQAFNHQWTKLEPSFREWLRKTGQDPLEQVFLEVDSDVDCPRGIDSLLQKLKIIAQDHHSSEQVLKWQHEIEQVLVRWQRKLMQDGELGVFTIEEVDAVIRQELEERGGEARQKYHVSMLKDLILKRLHRRGLLLLLEAPARPPMVLLNVDLACKTLAELENLAAEPHDGMRGKFSVSALHSRLEESRQEGKEVDEKVWRVLANESQLRAIIQFGLISGSFYQLGNDSVLVPSVLPELEEIRDSPAWKAWESLKRFSNVETDGSPKMTGLEVIIRQETSSNRENLLFELLSYLSFLDLKLAWRGGALLSATSYLRSKTSSSGNSVELARETWAWIEVSGDGEDASKLNTISMTVRGSRSLEFQRELSTLTYLMGLFLGLEFKKEGLIYRCGNCGSIVKNEVIESLRSRNESQFICMSCAAMIQLDVTMETSRLMMDVGSHGSLEQRLQRLLSEDSPMIQQLLSRFEAMLDVKLDSLKSDIISAFQDDFRRFVMLVMRQHEELKEHYRWIYSRLVDVDKTLAMEFQNFSNSVSISLAKIRETYRIDPELREGFGVDDEDWQDRMCVKLGAFLESWFRERLVVIEEKLNEISSTQASILKGIHRLLILERWNDLPAILKVELERGKRKNKIKVWMGCPFCGKTASKPLEVEEWRRWIRVSAKFGKALVKTVYCLINPTADVFKDYGDVFKEFKKGEELPEWESKKITKETLDHGGHERLRRAFLGTPEVFQWFTYSPEHGWICRDDSCPSKSET